MTEQKLDTEKEFMRPLRRVLRFARLVGSRLMSLATDTDINGTVDAIKKGMVLQGSNLWILICSTIIACIGLDTNSPAVIIGAMLISPLMSPILGIGLSAGINDKESLLTSFRNFAAAIVLSLVVAVIYFKLTPFGALTAEMQSRTAPTILDAFVALFGGLAGIIAGSRIDKTNAIPGVAIATALMPPLCTAGFGLATGDLAVFGGAFYLFFINAVLISLSTYLIVRFLKFPLVEYVNHEVAKRNKRFVYAGLVVIMIPSFIFLFTTLKDTRQKILIDGFIAAHINEDLDNGVRWTYKDENDSLSSLTVYYFGSYIQKDSVAKLESKLKNEFISSLMLKSFAPEDIALHLIPTDTPPDEDKARLTREVQAIRTQLFTIEQTQNNRLATQKQQLDSIVEANTKILADTLYFNQIQSEVKGIYPELESFTLAKTQNTQFGDSVSRGFLAVVRTRKDFSQSQRPEMLRRLEGFLKVKLKTDSLNILYN